MTIHDHLRLARAQLDAALTGSDRYVAIALARGHVARAEELLAEETGRAAEAVRGTQPRGGQTVKEPLDVEQVYSKG